MKILIVLYTLLSAFVFPADVIMGKPASPEAVDQQPRASESIQLLLSEEVVGAGETIWFQGLLSEKEGQVESSVLYVEVLNSREAVLQGIFSIKNGTARGQIQLPDTLSGGWYQVRAYTQWMRNFGENSFWSQPILVINPYEDKLDIQQSPSSSRNSEIQFFPEGGAFVEGLPNHVWVQLPEDMATDSLIAAKLISLQDSIPLAEVSLLSRGGLLPITPEFGKDYMLEIYAERGDTLREALPKPEALGATIHAQFERSGLQIETYHSKRDIYTVQLRTYDTLLYRQEYRNDSFSFNTAHADLPGGLLELNVLDKAGKLLAQRMLYHASPEETLQITLDKKTYLPREPVSASIRLAGMDQDAQVAVTVRKVNPLTKHLQQHKNTFGLIHQEAISEALSEAGRTEWINQTLIARESPFVPLENEAKTQTMHYSREDESLTVSGKVKGLNGEVAGMVAVLSVPGKNPYFEYDFVNEDGSFRIPIKEDVLGQKDIILQMADTSLQVSWTLDEKFAQESTYANMPLPAIPDLLSEEMLAHYSQSSKIKSQYDLFEAEDTKALSEKKFRFYGAPNFEIRMEDYIELPNFVEVNRELMPGIRLRDTKEGYNLDVFDIPSRTFLPGEPSVFLDGVLVHDLSYIIDFPPSEIEFIETVNRRTYYGEYRFDGTIAIYSKEGGAYLPTLSSSAKQAQASLYTTYQPFSRPDSLQAHEPDFRTLLHWQPSVQLNQESYALEFENADELGEFEVVVEGMARDGQKLYARKTYTVSLTDLP